MLLDGQAENLNLIPKSGMDLPGGQLHSLGPLFICNHAFWKVIRSIKVRNALQVLYMSNKKPLKTTSFSLKGFQWGQHHSRRHFCSILLVFLPYGLLGDGLQLLVYHCKPVLRLVHLNTGENSITAVNYLFIQALYIVK